MTGSAIGESGFGVKETHGILLRPEHTIRACSDKLGWASIYASLQRETPYEGEFGAVRDLLVILHLGGPVAVERRLGGKRERRVIPAGGLFIMPGGMDFGVRLEGELDSLHIYLRHEFMREVADDLGLGDGDLDILPSLGEPDLLAESLALEVSRALVAADQHAGVYADYLSGALASRLLRSHSRLALRDEATAVGLSPAQVALVKDFIEANLDHSVSLADIATACSLSPSHFARRFKGTMGVPPHHYLVQMRIERAKRLLRGKMPIIQVALECGFTHQEHLTSVFRRATGLTPAVFRRAART